MPTKALARRGREARAWLLDGFLPLWAERGPIEALDLHHQPADESDPTLRTLARRIYLFAEGRRLGWDADGCDEAVDAALGALLARPEISGEEPPPGVTEAAAAVFGLAHALQTGEDRAEIAPAIQRLLSSLEMPPAAGCPASPPPHLQLVEACLALDRAQPDRMHRANAKRLVSAFQSRLFDPSTGTVGEVFEADWSQPATVVAEHVEPGRHFAWACLLSIFSQTYGEPRPMEADTLYRFAVETLDPCGRAVQTVTRTGVWVDASRRVWPQAEALRAHLVEAAAGASAAADRAMRSFDILMDEHLTPEGGWIDRYGPDGLPISTEIRADVGFHIMLAFSDLIRITAD